MAEDQGQNGDRWTEEASVLLSHLGWEKIADSNIDIEGSDGLQHGIDSLFRYEDGFSSSKQGVFLEAKRYQTSSFRVAKLNDWVTCLDNKILELRRSEEFNKIYPAMAKTVPQNGLLVVWFHDTDNYRNFSSNFVTALLSVRTPRKRNVMSNRLFVLANDDILRMASLVSEIEQWNQKHQTNGFESKLKFFYPSIVEQGLVSNELPILNLEYIFSKFILATAQVLENGVPKLVYIVFYFGELAFNSFKRLKQALLGINIPKSHSQLLLYTYQRDDEFRKIKPDVEKLFTQLENVTFEIRSMNHFSDLPNWMKDYNLE